MCTTEIWTYRECGCHYHHPVACHPAFTTPPPKSPSRSILAAIPDTPPESPASPISFTASALNLDNIRGFARLRLYPAERQCSVQHTVHRQFLEPICDECLLEELGLQRELGPILGGRDRQQGLRGESWLLESNVEIQIEGEDEDEGIDDGGGDEAHDESEPRGRSRRRGMDISRESFRISSSLPTAEKNCLRSFRDELRGEEPEAFRQIKLAARASHEAMEAERPRSSWSDHVRDGLAVITRKKAKEQLRVSGIDAPPLDTAQSRMERPALSRLPMCKGLYQSWEEHLKADLDARQQKKSAPPEASKTERPRASAQHGPDSPHSESSHCIPSSPHTASVLSGQLRSPSEIPLLHELQALQIPSSDFEDSFAASDSSLLQAHPRHRANASTHLSHHSIDSTTSFRTARSRTSSVDSSPTETTRPTTANTLSLHPLDFPLTISTPHRPCLPLRSTSLFSPPASSPLLHSTPPLNQFPTSNFVCMHDKWVFTECGCNVTKVKSCVCDKENSFDPEVAHSADTRDGYEWYEDCVATDPVVRTREFMNPVCENCLAKE